MVNDDSEMNEVPGVYIVGKRKPSLTIKGNKKRIEKHINSFEKFKEKYKGIPYKTAFSKQ